jgi:hypothetical protein
MFLRIFSIVFPVFAIVGVGYLYSRWRRPDMTAANQLNMAVLLPALIFGVLSGKDFNIGQYGPLALAALVMIGNFGAFAL